MIILDFLNILLDSSRIDYYCLSNAVDERCRLCHISVFFLYVSVLAQGASVQN